MPEKTTPESYNKRTRICKAILEAGGGEISWISRHTNICFGAAWHLEMGKIPDNSRSCFMLSPMEKSNFYPDLIIFICNAEQACRLLTLSIFIDGVMPKIKIGGPTCRMSIIYPMIANEVNISFYDYTARRLCNVPNDKLLVSIPYKRIPTIIRNIDRCSGGGSKDKISP